MGQRAKKDREREQQREEKMDTQSDGLRKHGGAGKDTNVVGRVGKAEAPKKNDATLEYVRSIQLAFKSIGKRKLSKLKKAGSKKGLHNVSTKLMKQLIRKLKCAPPTDRQMAAIFKDAGVEPPAMTWSEFFLWLR